MKSIHRINRRLREFGLTPSCFVRRVLSGESKRPALANSIPKAGTNLLVRLLYHLPPMHRKLCPTLTNDRKIRSNRIISSLNPNQFAAAHLYYTHELDELLQKKRIKPIILIRDPRDMVVSAFKYITYIDHSHRLHNYFAQRLSNDSERLMAAIEGVSSENLAGLHASASIGTHLENYAGWLRTKNCLVLRFEDLVGPRGGGNADRQLYSILTLAEYLEIDLTPPRRDEVAKKLFDINSRTFSSGMIGKWKEHFHPEHDDRFSELAGTYLREMGYA